MFKKTLLFMLGLVLAASSANAQLIISEIMDGPLTGGLPKYIEVTNVSGSAIDLSNYDLAVVFNDANTTGEFDSTYNLSGILAAGGSVVVANEDTTFPSVFGASADFVDSIANINGDDTIGIVPNGSTTLASAIDIYGTAVDGTGLYWEYLDTRVTRHPSVNASNTSFTVGEWINNGVDSLDPVNTPDATLGSTVNTAAIGTPGGHILATTYDTQVGTGDLDTPTPALLNAISGSDLLNGIVGTVGGAGLHGAATGGAAVFSDGLSSAANNLDGLLADDNVGGDHTTITFDLGGAFDLTGLRIWTQNTGADARIFLNGRLAVDTNDDGVMDEVIGEFIIGGPGADAGSNTWGELDLAAVLGTTAERVQFTFFSVTDAGDLYRGDGVGGGGSIVKEIDLFGVASTASSSVNSWELYSH